MTQRLMAQHSLTKEEAQAQIANTIAARRFGTTDVFAYASAFSCSEQAGFISGQNLELDGCSYHGLI
jgi:3-oxoacyl-[acyl-carrier protein] reductase